MAGTGHTRKLAGQLNCGTRSTGRMRETSQAPARRQSDDTSAGSPPRLILQYTETKDDIPAQRHKDCKGNLPNAAFVDCGAGVWRAGRNARGTTRRTLN